MTPELERIGRILVEAEGGCWHEKYKDSMDYWKCSKCNIINMLSNPDFSKWENFGRLLKIAESKGIDFWIHPLSVQFRKREYLINRSDIDQIPLIVATEFIKIIKKED